MSVFELLEYIVNEVPALIAAAAVVSFFIVTAAVVVIFSVFDFVGVDFTFSPKMVFI